MRVKIIDHRKVEPGVAWYAIDVTSDEVELRGEAVRDPTYKHNQWVRYWVPIEEVDQIIRALHVLNIGATTTCEANKLTEAEMKKKIKSWKERKRSEDRRRN